MKIDSSQKTLIQFLSKVMICLIVLGTAFYLKTSHFLSGIDFNDLGIQLEDTTNFFIEFNQFGKILILASLAIVVLYIIQYKINIQYASSTFMDKFFLSYFLIYFLLLIITQVSHDPSGKMQLLSIFISSITYIQYCVFDFIPVGIILYIPLLYHFFIKN